MKIKHNYVKNYKKPIMEIDENGKRKGLTNFPKSKVDTLTYQPLSDKIKKFLSGKSTSLDADNVQDVFDQAEGEWNENSDNIPLDPLNAQLDKDEIIDVENSVTEASKRHKKQLESMKATVISPDKVSQDNEGKE